MTHDEKYAAVAAAALLGATLILTAIVIYQSWAVAQ